MSERAEEAATEQFVGFLERTMEAAGGLGIRIEVTRRSWQGEPATTVVAKWSAAKASTRP